jgi:trehalose-phosphatase
VTTTAGRPSEPLGDAVASRLAGRPLILMLDVDGTLAPIAPRPEAAIVPLETRRIVAALAARSDVHVALVSGRAAADARRMVGVSNLWVVGNHGAETVGPDGEVSVDPQVAPYRVAVAQASRKLSSLVAPVPGVLVEDKTWTLSIHHRLADPAVVPRLKVTVDGVAAGLGLRVTEGKQVIEVRPPVHVNKGTAVLNLARQLGAFDEEAGVFFAGDDATDEDAFRLLRAHLPNAVTVRVGESGTTAAEFTVPDTVAVRRLLESL